MADQPYYSVFTKKGLELLTEAIRNGTKLGITHMAFGDGGGSLPVPNESFTKLVNEVHRTQLNSLSPDPNNANWLRAEAIIASATGGFNIRELGLYAGSTLIAYSNYPATYKPNPSDGTARIMTFRMVLQIDNTASFELKIDADIVLATMASVNEAKQEIYKKTITKVSSIDDLIPLQNIEGNTVHVQSRGIYRYSIKDNQWLPDLITERQIITVFSFQEMNSLDRWNNRTVYLSGIGMYVYNQSSAKWIKTASISKRTSEYNIVASNTSDDNTAQIYALLEKDTVFVVDTTVCLNTPLLIDKTLTFVCEGQGMILIGDQMTEKEAINVQAPLTKLHDLRCDNPLKLKSATGGKQTCVSIQADNVTVSKSVFYRMLHSCAVQPRSVLLKEVQGTKYLDNYAFECIGVGAGDNDDGSNNYGEDRGDAFVCWGAKAMMVGNYAYAGEGEDCRIAFHCEGLGDFVPPENQTKFDNSDYVIANNYAFGSFRRHFVFEAVQRGQMSNLISDGGATWWAFAFPQSHHCTVNNITIRYDRKNSTAGAAWKPVRGAIGLLNDNSGLRFNNVQIIMDDTDDDAFVVRDSATGKHDVQINNINIKGTRLSKGFGFNIIGSTRLNVTNFSIDNMIMAFYSYGAESIKIKNGEVTGADYLFNSQNNVDFSAKDIDNTKGKIIFNNGGKGDIQDIRFKEMDGTDFEIYAWTFDKIRIKDCSSDRTGGGLFSIQGTKDIINSDGALDYRDNENFKTKVQTTTALLGSLTSKVNTNYKGQGKTVFVGTDVYISTGGLASDTWISISGKNSIVPA